MEQKQILEEILQKRAHRTIHLSSVIREFVDEAQELRTYLASENGNLYCLLIGIGTHLFVKVP